MAKDENSSREKPYRVFFFSSNLDHVLFGNANNERYNKLKEAKNFSNDFYGEPLKLASYLVNHACAVSEKSYRDSWTALSEKGSSLKACTNINLLVEDLLRQAKVTALPENDMRP